MIFYHRRRSGEVSLTPHEPKLLEMGDLGHQRKGVAVSAIPCRYDLGLPSMWNLKCHWISKESPAPLLEQHLK